MKKLSFKNFNLFVVATLASLVTACNVTVGNADNKYTNDSTSTHIVSNELVYSLNEGSSFWSHHFFIAKTLNTATIKELALVEIEDRPNEYRDVTAAFERIEKPVSYATIERLESLMSESSNKESTLTMVRQNRLDMVYLQLRSSLGTRVGGTYNLIFTFIRTDGSNDKAIIPVILRPIN